MVDFGITGEQGLALAHHFRKDAAYRPHVYCGRVMPGAQQYFWGAVPESNDLGPAVSIYTQPKGDNMYLMRVSPHRDAEGTCKPKICQLKVVLFVNEQILWLQIAVKDAMGVAVEEA